MFEFAAIAAAIAAANAVSAPFNTDRTPCGSLTIDGECIDLTANHARQIVRNVQIRLLAQTMVLGSSEQSAAALGELFEGIAEDINNAAQGAIDRVEGFQ